MPRWKGIVKQVAEHTVVISFEDGQEAIFPREKLQSGISEGTIVYVSVNVDKIAAILKQAHLSPEKMPFGASDPHG